MEILRREKAFEGEYLRIIRKTAITTESTEIIWETVERTNIYGPGCVIIVGLTDKGELILERHWRAPIESYVIQFPGGLTDTVNESEEETAHREFFEETGYVARKLIPILSAANSPGVTPLIAKYYFTSEAEYIGNHNKEISEDIEVITVPKNNLHQFLAKLPDDTELDLRVPGIVWMLESEGLL